jgi:predicted AlkP superfamily phosphohydrolase/phosphomutase
MKTIIAGFDAYDPRIFEKLNSEGKTPNLGQLANLGGYSRFAVTNPPQSEVSWTSIATGMNPGYHGIFDFVHRNPANYGPQVSLLPTKTSILGKQFIPPHAAKTIFEVAVDDGYPGISLWWPATFPAKQASPVWTLPGLGTPDIFGRLGVGIFYSLDGSTDGEKKTRIETLSTVNKGRFRGVLEGPTQMSFSSQKSSTVKFELNQVDDNLWQLIIGKKAYDLKPGQWSNFIEITFSVSLLIGIKAITRAIFIGSGQNPELYFLPLQLHPLRSPWPYGTPKRLMKGVWKNPGAYLTLGWPQDTTGLEEGFINDEQFLSLCDDIVKHREKTLMWLLDSFNEGVLGCIFDSLDRIQHMFYRDRMDIIEAWYVKLDAMFGRILDKAMSISPDNDIRVLAVSDHGFGEFNYKVNLNQWLIKHSYLVSGSPEGEGNLNQVEWDQTSAYAVGLNSIYLNLEGREGQGSVNAEQQETVLNRLQEDLLSWKGPDGTLVVGKTIPKIEAFDGPLAEFGPDLIIGYRAGYRASAQTGMGEWGANEIERNQDHWGADHCFDADSVPGVLFSNHGLEDVSNPSYSDIPLLALRKEIDPRRELTGPSYSDEDQEKINERLKELGYL